MLSPNTIGKVEYCTNSRPQAQVLLPRQVLPVHTNSHSFCLPASHGSLTYTLGISQNCQRRRSSASDSNKALGQPVSKGDGLAPCASQEQTVCLHVHMFGAPLRERRFCCNDLWCPSTNNLAVTRFSHRGASLRATNISIAEGVWSLM